MWPHVYVICNTTVPWNNFHDVHDIQNMKSETFDLKKTRLTCVCSVFLSVGDLLVQITNRPEHQTHTDDIYMRPHTA